MRAALEKLLGAVQMDLHNEAVVASKKGKAWSGDFVRKELLDGIAMAKAALESEAPPLARWRTQYEMPAKIPATALIVIRDDDGELLLLSGIYNMTESTSGKWHHEDTDEPMKRERYWWLAERDLMTSVPAPLKIETSEREAR